ncbi:MAG: MATE family efflux transporter [Ruminococcaceae bacterium]|nr:MATE family efflux transporter [Oscillospiraceae bacterium]
MRRRNQYELNMTEGSILKNVLLFAFPFMLSNILQLLYNAADLVVVGRFAGHDAMAAVGATGALINLLVNVFLGFSLGVSVVVSRKYGAKDAEGISRAVHTSVVLAVISGVLAMIVGFIFSKRLLILMDTPEGPVLDGATLYMKIIFAGVPAMIFYNFGAAILRAVGDTKRPLYILAMTGIVNVVLNLILVLGFGMSVEGVAIATATSNYLSALAVLYILIASDSVYKIYPKELKIYKKELLEVIRIGLPAGIQGSVFSLSNSVIQSAVNSFGAAAIAGSTASGNIEGFIYTSMNSFYQATVTSVSQNYGAKNEKRINQSITIPMICAIVTGVILSGLCILFCEPLLGIYITDSVEAMAFGRSRLYTICIGYFLCGIMDVLTGALRGLGSSTLTMINSLVGACGFRIFWILMILPNFRSPEALFLCFPFSWLAVIIMHFVCLIFVKHRAMKKLQAQLKEQE